MGHIYSDTLPEKPMENPFKLPWFYGKESKSIMDDEGNVVMTANSDAAAIFVVDSVNSSFRVRKELEKAQPVKHEVENKLEPGAVVDVPGIGSCRLVEPLESGYPRNVHDVRPADCALWEVKPLEGATVPFSAYHIGKAGHPVVTVFVPKTRIVGA